MKNEKKFKEYLTVLSEIHDRQISPLLASVYWKSIEPYGDKECEAAFNQLIQSGKFFPKPADMIEILRGKESDEGMVAWIKVVKAVRQVGSYQSVQFDDPVIHSVLAFMGGWPATGEWLEAELKWKQKEFERLYVVMKKDNGKPISHLPGIIEINNAANGYEREPDIIKIGNDRFSKDGQKVIGYNNLPK